VMPLLPALLPLDPVHATSHLKEETIHRWPTPARERVFGLAEKQLNASLFPLKQGLQSRINNLPLILAGPMLRRVDPRAVTIWLAMRQIRPVKLRVLETDGKTVRMEASVHPSDLGGSIVRLGPHLYIVCLVATAPTGSPELQPGKLYYYNLLFDGREDVTLETPGILSVEGGKDAMTRVAYQAEGNPLPSLCLPAGSLDKLRIVHSSCRKPHAESLDALQILDDILRSNAKDPLGRPQQLFLTGDQIYADDVADVLLPILTDAGDVLLGAEEPLPGFDQPTTAKQLLPDTRQKLITSRGGLTSDHAPSHLISFGEFCAMYLMAWSEVLWPSVLPTFEELYATSRTTSKSYGKGGPIMLTHPLASRYDQQTTNLTCFRRSLIKVRRALANIATYMIFDDHEVTDDWYMNRQWMGRVFNKRLGARTIANALLGFALFQSWGNRAVALHSDEAWTALIKAAQTWTGKKFEDSASEAEIRRILYVLSTPLEDEIPRTGKVVRWHFAAKWKTHEILVLDMRTRRGYPRTRRLQPVLLSSAAVNDEFEDFDKDLSNGPSLGPDAITVLVVPAPIVDIPFIEGLRRAGLEDEEKAFGRDFEALSGCAAAFNALLTRITHRSGAPKRIVMLSGDVHYGYASRIEHWINPQENGTSQAQIVVANLTASALKNQESKGLTSTLRLHRNGFGVWRSSLPPAPLVRLTWTLIGSEMDASVISVGNCLLSPEISSLPFLAPVDKGYPRQSRVAFLEDAFGDDVFPFDSVELQRRPQFVTRTALLPERGGADRGIVFQPIHTLPTDITQRNQVLLEAEKNWIEAVKRLGGIQLVGVNNLGVVRFEQDQSANSWSAVQELWWWIEETAVLVDKYLKGQLLEAKPYSRAVVSLKLEPAPPVNVLKK
jgi:hypothetical protein